MDVRLVRLIAGMLFVVALVIASSEGTSQADGQSPPRPGAGKLLSLSVFPERVVLHGVAQTQQLIVTGHYANGGCRDLTPQAEFQVADPQFVRVKRQGVLAPVADGITEVVAVVDGQSTKLDVTIAQTGREQPINFANEVMPVFTKLGCNAGACHGKAEGQNGFKLSLLGFEPQQDYVAITRESRGRRVFSSAPERSLLLRKPAGFIGHGGGKLLEPDSPDYQLLVRWIAAGTPLGQPSDPKVIHITVEPAHSVLSTKAQQQIAVMAHYSDGSKADATLHAQYESNNSEMVSVSDSGRVETLDRNGEGSIMVRYLGHVAVFRATIPTDLPAEEFPRVASSNLVDEHVFAKLRDLGIPPSGLCTDGEFLRRASLDIAGTLPAAAEAEKFLADTDPKKRVKLVDELLERPEYAYYFALKWGDILRNRLGKTRQEEIASDRTKAFHRWIHDSLASNKPYDQFVREIITAVGKPTGSAVAQPPVAWYSQLLTSEALVDDTAQAFLGTRIQCAQCHHHPFEKWSQDDYWGLAAFYARVRNNAKPFIIGESNSGLEGEISLLSSGQVTSPQGKSYTSPKVLDGQQLEVSEGQDPREQLVDWMVERDNPLFARALVNRYWGHFFGRGIVEPIDDLRVTNPPSNPALLDALAKDFVEHQFDLKHLIRLICTSRTYQLSSTPNELNKDDQQNFSRYVPKRLPAEALLDAVDQVTGSHSKFGSAKDREGVARRAIALPDTSAASPFLTMFGKPERDSACECERSADVTLSQRLHLMNSQLIGEKLKSDTCRAGAWAAASRPDRENIQEAYLWAFARAPTPSELAAVEGHLVGKPKRQAYEDLLWALINSQEFQFNH